MTGGAKDLLASERGVFCIVVLIAATILVALDKLTGTAWASLVTVVAGILVASKTATNIAEKVPTAGA